MKPTEQEIEALANEMSMVFCRASYSFNAVARHVLSRPAPPGTIRLGTGLTEAQRNAGRMKMNLDADAYGRAAHALDRAPWDTTPEGESGWKAIYDRLLQLATDLRAAAEPPVDPRIAVLRERILTLCPICKPDDEARAILAALDKMGGAGG